MADQPAEVILGVDTHADVHVAALLDSLGRLQGHPDHPGHLRRLPAAAGPGPAATASPPVPGWRAPAPTAPA
jgi:hypothetical protein